METACATFATLAEFTAHELVVPTLTGMTTSAVISELAGALHRLKGIPQPFDSGLAALNRELLTSMVLDAGAAFPQVKPAELADPVFALGRSPEPLSWRAKSFPPIQLVFLIGLPARPHRYSQRLVDGLSQLARDIGRLDRLRQVRTARQMIAILDECRL
jgi:mannitol/fructose-specific phosphotransferase system IIA component (Ntr-type)